MPVASHSRGLLERLAASDTFQKSKRLRDLLLFLGERSLQDPCCTLREQEIGVEVFGRPPDYDTSHDTLVRVHVSQLRKKLQEYFLAEGRKGTAGDRDSQGKLRPGIPPENGDTRDRI